MAGIIHLSRALASADPTKGDVFHWWSGGGSGYLSRGFCWRQKRPEPTPCVWNLWDQPKPVARSGPPWHLWNLSLPSRSRHWVCSGLGLADPFSVFVGYRLRMHWPWCCCPCFLRNCILLTVPENVKSMDTALVFFRFNYRQKLPQGLRGPSKPWYHLGLWHQFSLCVCMFRWQVTSATRSKVAAAVTLCSFGSRYLQPEPASSSSRHWRQSGVTTDQHQARILLGGRGCWTLWFCSEDGLFQPLIFTQEITIRLWMPNFCCKTQTEKENNFADRGREGSTRAPVMLRVLINLFSYCDNRTKMFTVMEANVSVLITSSQTCARKITWFAKVARFFPLTSPPWLLRPYPHWTQREKWSKLGRANPVLATGLYATRCHVHK